MRTTFCHRDEGGTEARWWVQAVRLGRTNQFPHSGYPYSAEKQWVLVWLPLPPHSNHPDRGLLLYVLHLVLNAVLAWTRELLQRQRIGCHSSLRR